MVSYWILFGLTISCFFFSHICINVTAKFDGYIPGNKRGQYSVVEKTTIHVQSSSALAMFTDASGSSISVLDYATYAILAIAGFLILLFITVLVGTILFFCHTKDKKKRYG